MNGLQKERDTVKIKRFIGGILEANCYVVSPDAKASDTDAKAPCFIIDPGYESKKIIKYINDNGFEAEGILLTHHHTDHSGCAARIRKELGCPIMIHREDADRYREDADRLLEDGDVLTLDGDGNLLATTTSEYAQSYPVGDTGMAPLSTTPCSGGKCDGATADADSFMGLKFGEVFAGTNLVQDADEPTLLRATFTPKKSLAGFDDYYVYVTPKTHKVAKVYACAKEAVDPGATWRRHYLIEALEKKYSTWARPCSWCRPVYRFYIGEGRYVTACLAGASRDYETVLVAWDDALLTAAADETEAVRAEARKNAAERRSRRVTDAADAF